MDAATPHFKDVMPSFKRNLKSPRPAASLSPKPPETVAHFPEAPWKDAGGNKNVARVKPLNIAHRGFKAKYPENSMSAFTHAIKVGAQVLETDVHLSRDGEIVLSHDSTLQRCFGINKRIVDCDWQYLSSLRTKREPFEPLVRLDELLRFLSTPERKHIWLLLDIKLDNDAEIIMRAIARVLHSIPSEQKPWNERIILGCWTAEFLSICHIHLPAYPVCLISYSLVYARQFIQVPNIIFNLKLEALMGPGGAQFLIDAKNALHDVFAWTVNDESFMWWSLRHGLDGIVTDKPDVCRRVCDEWEDGSGCHRKAGYGDDFVDKVNKASAIGTIGDEDDGITVLQRVNILIIAVVLYVAGSVFATVHHADLTECTTC
ncbi:hypothetical protein ACJ72_04437 [Emergomyces africanus]|uniref:GP-PDE domain-containing protein n=1 Tax=Emergomyces africanus TaxID=1955775 RepID=A0A1B7NWS5_9EURO|nr:hypothetical protein ACJ72_04437 [Emergomyces africanus]